MGQLYIGLVHHPIYNKAGDVVTTALTNYDIHDIARTAVTYDIPAYFIIHPIPSQQALAKEIISHWQEGFGATYNPDRKTALDRVVLVNEITDAIERIAVVEGERPRIITTDARHYPHTISYQMMRERLQQDETPYLLLFGTGYGMTKEWMQRFDFILAPIEGRGEYNHLCVRAAAAIILDRLLAPAWWE